MKQFVLAVWLLASWALPGYALPYLGADTGLLFIINAEEGGAPSPVILQGIGATFPWIEPEPGIDGMFLTSGVMFSGTWYQYLNDRAIPADVERADTVWVLLANFDLQFGYLFTLSEKLSLGTAVMTALMLPLPLFATDNGSQYLESMYVFFYTELKFLYVGGEVFLRWAIINEFNLNFKLRGLYQPAALFDDSSISRFNGTVFQLLISIEIKL